MGADLAIYRTQGLLVWTTSVSTAAAVLYLSYNGYEKNNDHVMVFDGGRSPVRAGRGGDAYGAGAAGFYGGGNGAGVGPSERTKVEFIGSRR